MQKPLNIQEHTWAFWKFLFLFLITVGTLIGAVYFNFETPYQENRLLKQQVEQNQVETLIQEKMVNNLRDTRMLIDSIQIAGTNRVLLEERINENLKELLSYQLSDSSVVNKINKEVIILTSQYLDTKRKMMDLGDCPSKVEKMEADKIKMEGTINTLKADNDNLRRDNDALREMLKRSK